jgi:hypothetical protein
MPPTNLGLWAGERSERANEPAAGESVMRPRPRTSPGEQVSVMSGPVRRGPGDPQSIGKRAHAQAGEAEVGRPGPTQSPAS